MSYVPNNPNYQRRVSDRPGDRIISRPPEKKAPMKLVWPAGKLEWSLNDTRLQIGRAKTNEIVLTDLMVSGKHAIISNGVISDLGSTNGTHVNGRQLTSHTQKLALKPGDKIIVGDTHFVVEKGEVSKEVLSSSKRFPDQNAFKDGSRPENKDASTAASSPNSSSEPAPKKEETEEDRMTVPELMESEFSKIIGHDKIKAQLRQFYKKVQLDNIREEAARQAEAQASQGPQSLRRRDDKKRLYHMIFSGPPGTGKTTMANVVSKVMLKMKLVENDKVVFVNNPLELLGSYVGQTAPKVDAKVEEARGGIIFIDEAYSIVKGSNSEGKENSFGREAIDTLMKHMDPPTCVFIFAGYEKPMEDFLKVNEGLSRRIPYRYNFEAYTIEQLVQITIVMCQSKGEKLDDGVQEKLPELLLTLSPQQLQTQNAGVVSNWVSFAQMERDDRLDLDEALKNPSLAFLLCLCDFEKALEKLREMVTPA